MPFIQVSEKPSSKTGLYYYLLPPLAPAASSDLTTRTRQGQGSDWSDRRERRRDASASSPEDCKLASRWTDSNNPDTKKENKASPAELSKTQRASRPLVPPLSLRYNSTVISSRADKRSHDSRETPFSAAM
jgi:hypothetical protein